MIDRVEGGTHVEQAEQRHLLTVSSIDDVGDDFQ